jgi:hypothetical protein
MAQKKKKGPPPRSKEEKKKQLSVSQLVFTAFALLIVIIMILGLAPGLLQSIIP